MPAMNRREAVKAAGVLLGGAVVASSGILSACKAESKQADVPARAMVLSADDQALA